MITAQELIKHVTDPYAYTIGALSAILRHSYGKSPDQIVADAKRVLDELEAELRRREEGTDCLLSRENP
jgi:hypothetical protein